MPSIIFVGVDLRDRSPDQTGPVDAEFHLRIIADVDADSAAEGAGVSHVTKRGRVGRAAYNALRAAARRAASETLTGALEGLCPISRDP